MSCENFIEARVGHGDFEGQLAAKSHFEKVIHTIHKDSNWLTPFKMIGVNESTNHSTVRNGAVRKRRLVYRGHSASQNRPPGEIRF
jgi:hypothetical protein